MHFRIVLTCLWLLCTSMAVSLADDAKEGLVVERSPHLTAYHPLQSIFIRWSDSLSADSNCKGKLPSNNPEVRLTLMNSDSFFWFRSSKEHAHIGTAASGSEEFDWIVPSDLKDCDCGRDLWIRAEFTLTDGTVCTTVEPPSSELFELDFEDDSEWAGFRRPVPNRVLTGGLLSTELHVHNGIGKRLTIHVYRRLASDLGSVRMADYDSLVLLNGDNLAVEVEKKHEVIQVQFFPHDLALPAAGSTRTLYFRTHVVDDADDDVFGQQDSPTFVYEYDTNSILIYRPSATTEWVTGTTARVQWTANEGLTLDGSTSLNVQLFQDRFDELKSPRLLYSVGQASRPQLDALAIDIALPDVLGALGDAAKVYVELSYSASPTSTALFRATSATFTLRRGTVVVAWEVIEGNVFVANSSQTMRISSDQFETLDISKVRVSSSFGGEGNVKLWAPFEFEIGASLILNGIISSSGTTPGTGYGRVTNIGMRTALHAVYASDPESPVSLSEQTIPFVANNVYRCPLVSSSVVRCEHVDADRPLAFLSTFYSLLSVAFIWDGGNCHFDDTLMRVQVNGNQYTSAELGGIFFIEETSLSVETSDSIAFSVSIESFNTVHFSIDQVVYDAKNGDMSFAFVFRGLDDAEVNVVIDANIVLSQTPTCVETSQSTTAGATTAVVDGTKGTNAATSTGGAGVKETTVHDSMKTTRKQGDGASTDALVATTNADEAAVTDEERNIIIVLASVGAVCLILMCICVVVLYKTFRKPVLSHRSSAREVAMVPVQRAQAYHPYNVGARSRGGSVQRERSRAQSRALGGSRSRSASGARMMYH